MSATRWITKPAELSNGIARNDALQTPRAMTVASSPRHALP